MIESSLTKLSENGKLDNRIVLWGINGMTAQIVAWLWANGYGENLLFIADNFKYTFYQTYEGLPVYEPAKIRELQKDSVTAVFAVGKKSGQYS